MEERPSEFYTSQKVTVQGFNTAQRTGTVTELIEILYHKCPSGSPGRTWWPRISLSDGTHAVFCPEVVRPS
jgi:hypothetical protein